MFKDKVGGQEGFEPISNSLEEGDKVLADRAFWRCAESRVDLLRPANTNSPNEEQCNDTRQVLYIYFLRQCGRNLIIGPQ